MPAKQTHRGKGTVGDRSEEALTKDMDFGGTEELAGTFFPCWFNPPLFSVMS